MTEAARKLIESFDQLPAVDKQLVVTEIIRLVLASPYAAPDDTDLTRAADQVFLDLDRREGAE